MSTTSATVDFTQRSETRAWVKSALRFEALMDSLRAATDDADRAGHSAPAAGPRGHDVERGTGAIAS